MNQKRSERPHKTPSESLLGLGEGVGQENVSRDLGVKGRISAGDSVCMWGAGCVYRESGCFCKHLEMASTQRKFEFVLLRELVDLTFLLKRDFMHLTLGNTVMSILFIYLFSSSNHGHKWFIGLSLSSQTFPALVCLRGQVTMGVVRDTSSTAARESSNETFLWTLVRNASQSPASPTPPSKVAFFI